MPSQPRCYLLEVPEDIRHLIYKAYTTFPDGLSYDYDSGKLLDDRNAPVDLALIRTCKQVASEMDGLALRLNTIHFKTCFTDIQRHRDRAWRAGLALLDDIRLDLLNSAHASLVATDALEVMSSRYPWFRQSLSHILAIMEGSPHPYGREGALQLAQRYFSFFFLATLSVPDGQAVAATVRLASTTGNQFRSDALALLQKAIQLNEKRMEGVRANVERGYPIFDHILELLKTNLNLDRLDPIAVANYRERRWVIPTDDDITQLWSIMGSSPHPPKEKWSLPATGRVSAAYSAVRFLQSLTGRARAHIRQISLVEDRVALHPDYAYGLIPYCIANPRIRITRRYLMWRNLRLRYGGITISEGICQLLADEAGVFELGMPRESYSVIFDPEEDPLQAKRLFQRFVFKAIAWSRAMAEWEKQQLPSLPRLAGDPWEIHLDMIEQTVANMAAGIGPIRCDFDCRRLCDPEKALEKIRQSPPGPELRVSLRGKFNHISKYRRPTQFELDPPIISRQEYSKMRLDGESLRLASETDAYIRDAREEFPDSCYGQWTTPVPSENELNFYNDDDVESSDSDLDSDDSFYLDYKDDDNDPMYVIAQSCFPYSNCLGSQSYPSISRDLTSCPAPVHPRSISEKH